MEILMSKVRQKEIADAIRDVNLKSSDFELKAKSPDYFIINYKKYTLYKFEAHFGGQSWEQNYYHTPGINGEFTTEKNIYKEPWSITFEGIKIWLESLSEDLKIDNPWTEIENMSSNTFFEGEISEVRFSSEERDFVDEKLDVIFEALKEFANDLDTIKSDLDYLKVAGDKVSKKDWGLMMMGNIMGWAMGNVIKPDTLQAVMDIIVQNLKHQNLLG